MNVVQIILPDGTSAALHQAESGRWVCPVCGNPELGQQPYFPEASPSFEMCTCGFEFGFDDDPAASANAVQGVQANWLIWRSGLASKLSPAQLQSLKQRLSAIGQSVQ